jgi:hypothetical protein
MHQHHGSHRHHLTLSSVSLRLNCEARVIGPNGSFDTYLAKAVEVIKRNG